MDLDAVQSLITRDTSILRLVLSLILGLNCPQHQKNAFTRQIAFQSSVLILIKAKLRGTCCSLANNVIQALQWVWEYPRLYKSILFLNMFIANCSEIGTVDAHDMT